MVNKLHKQTTTSEFESHWVPPYFQICVTTQLSLVLQIDL